MGAQRNSDTDSFWDRFSVDGNIYGGTERHEKQDNRHSGNYVSISICRSIGGNATGVHSMQSLDRFLSDPLPLEGYQWLANNTESDATVLAWWDYADGIEKIGHRGVVINEASESIKHTIGGYSTPGRPWRKIEYWLWYPYEDEEKVRDVAGFFISENVTSAKEIARKYVANYVLVMSDDLGKYYPVVKAAGGNFSNYMRRPTNLSSGISDIRPYLKKKTVFTGIQRR
jgi:asparagine N-glycosylation enzyme membrane subunit Stt3